ncbi:MAG: lamin tail domain-containing protein [Candidatus Pacebacteria bacterium]|nr:lamin tail domain-containing protein [Candidatus Paceibacterota bacterium]
MKKIKTLIIAYVSFFLSIFSPVMASDLYDSGEYLELSKLESEKILSGLPKILNDEWKDAIEKGNSREAVAYSFLKRATTFETWDYLLADLPAESLIKLLKAYKDYSADESVFGAVLAQVEKLSVDKANEYLRKYLVKNNAKISFGAIKGGFSKDNKEIIFQYILIYVPGEGENGNVFARFYSPEEILLPLPKSSYGSAIGLYSDQEKIGPFMLEAKGSTKNDYFKQISWDYTKETILNVIFDKDVPDLRITPLSWQQEYIYDPIRKSIENIPFIGTALADKAKIEVLEGKEDISGISKEIGDMLKEDDMAVAAKAATPPEASTNKKAEKKTIKQVKAKASSAKTTTKKKTVTKKNKAAEKKEKEEEKKTVEEGQGAMILFSAEERKIQTAKIIQELIRRRSEQKKDALIRTVEIEKTKEKTDKDKEENRSPCAKDNSLSPKRTSIIFNEIAWMGKENDPSAEWIELKNIGKEAVNMQGWNIYDKDSKINIALNKSLAPGGMLLLEREESAVKNVKADTIYSGSLSNSSETLYLFDDECRLQDIIIATNGWPAGDNDGKKTMERSNDLSWHTHSGNSKDGISGTPKKENSLYERPQNIISNPVVNSGGSSSSASGGSSVPATPSPIICNKDTATKITSPIIINEVSWMGGESSSNDEWIELRNSSIQEVSLAGWQLLDKDNNIEVVFDANDKILADGFYLLERTDDGSVKDIKADKVYTGTLNDKDESLTLFDGDCHEVDRVIAGPDWPAGDSSSKKTMERDDDLLHWHTYNGIGKDDISGLLGTPKRINSPKVENEEEPDNGSEEGNDKDGAGGSPEEPGDQDGIGDKDTGTDEEENDQGEDTPPQEGGSSEGDTDPADGTTEASRISDPTISISSFSNQVILTWEGDLEASQYDIVYEIGKSVDRENTKSIGSYTSLDIAKSSGKFQAIISDLYWEKEYHFLIKSIGTEEVSSEFSQELIIRTGVAKHKLVDKYPDYTNRHKVGFNGPDNSWSNDIDIRQESNSMYFSNILFSMNGDSYIHMKKGNDYGLVCYDHENSQKWFHPAIEADPIIGKDGTVYYSSGSGVVALSPSGKEKWKVSLGNIVSKNVIIDREGAIYALADLNGGNSPSLYRIKDQLDKYDIEEIIPSSSILGGSDYFSSTDLAMEEDGSIYFAINNKLMKYKEGSFKVRVIEAGYSQDYQGEKNVIPKMMRLSLGKDDKVYLSMEKLFITPNYRVNGIVVLDSKDIEGATIWSLNARINSSINVLGVDGNNVYVAERSGNSMFRISSLSSLDGSLNWKKEWSDGTNREILFIDDRGYVYFKNGTRLSSFDPTRIVDTSGNNDLVYDLDIGKSLSLFLNYSIMEDKIILISNDMMIQIDK